MSTDDISSLLNDYYSTSNKATDVGWILPNGDMIDLGRELDKESRNLTHENSLANLGIWVDRDDFVAKTGIIRVDFWDRNDLSLMISSDKPPTKEQELAIKTYLAPYASKVHYDVVHRKPTGDVDFPQMGILSYSGDIRPDVLREMPIMRALRTFKDRK